MGYPPNFEIPVSDTQAYRQFGNSVAVPVVERLAKSVVETLERPAGQRSDLILNLNEKAGRKALHEEPKPVSYFKSKSKHRAQPWQRSH
jgi:hypothetical protein